MWRKSKPKKEEKLVLWKHKTDKHLARFRKRKRKQIIKTKNLKGAVTEVLANIGRLKGKYHE